MAVAGAVASLASAGASALEFTAGNWKMDISGSVNAFYTNLSCDKTGAAAPAIVATLPVCGPVQEDSSAIQNGLLPGYINFSASTQAKGLDLKAVIGFWPGTSSGNGINNNGTTPDTRTVYVEFGSKNWGSFKLGRDIGLFQQNAILNDMTLLSVGSGAGFQGAINTTLGMIGNGYIYSEFQPQITYTTPNWNGFNAAIGAFQPRNTAGIGPLVGVVGAVNTFFGDRFDTIGWQGLAQYEWKGQASGKLWASFATAEGEAQGGGIFLPGTTLKGEGYEVGGKIGFGGFNLLGTYFWGEGLGEAIQFVNGHDFQGNQRDSDGYLIQGTYKFGDFQIGLSYGENTLDGTAADAGLVAGVPGVANLVSETSAWVIQGKYDLMPGLSLIAEYVSSEQSAQNCITTALVGCDQEADTFAIGAIVFF
jgi:predicted porin